jgi:hypothetical protein
MLKKLRNHVMGIATVCIFGLLFASASIAQNTSVSVTLTSLTVSPATLAPGGTVTVTAVMTANQTVSGYPIEVNIAKLGYHGVNFVARTNYVAGQPVSMSVNWTVPASTLPGTFRVLFHAFDPAWQSPAMAAGTTTFTVTAAGPAVQKPGPSAALYANPYYVCSTNYYVSPTGSDSNPGTSAGAAWLTLQHADGAIKNGTGGVCINVAPGTYAGVVLHNGGYTATSTGYVTYRCTTMDACTVNGNAGTDGENAFQTIQNVYGYTPPNYIQIDGFNMVGTNQVGGVGLSVWNGNNGAPLTSVAAHHIWLLNSIVSNFGQSGAGLAASEYYYVIHDTFYNNSQTTCGSQGSGIAINIMHPALTTSGGTYVPTSDDQANPNPLLGPTWTIMTGLWFHNVVEWNVVYNNSLAYCQSGNTDGNGIIFDTNIAQPYERYYYPYPSLAAFNVVYSNGGGGVHIFLSQDVYAANNAAYQNQQDPHNSGSGKAMIDDTAGQNNVFVNNIAYAIASGYAGNCYPRGGTTTPYSQYLFPLNLNPNGNFPLSDTANSNITYLSGVSCNAEVEVNSGLAYPTAGAGKNYKATNPMWVDVGSTSTGSETTPPVGANFALQPGSPAIGNGTPEPWLPAQASTIGPCHESLAVCP